MIDMSLLSIYADRQCQVEIKILYGNMVKFFIPDARCKYCNTQKAGGGATRLKQHLAGRGVEVVHYRNVPPDVR